LEIVFWALVKWVNVDSTGYFAIPAEVSFAYIFRERLAAVRVEDEDRVYKNVRLIIPF